MNEWMNASYSFQKSSPSGYAKNITSQFSLSTEMPNYWLITTWGQLLKLQTSFVGEVLTDLRLGIVTLLSWPLQLQHTTWVSWAYFITCYVTIWFQPLHRYGTECEAISCGFGPGRKPLSSVSLVCHEHDFLFCVLLYHPARTPQVLSWVTPSGSML